jgi:hypothetical protein
LYWGGSPREGAEKVPCTWDAQIKKRQRYFVLPYPLNKCWLQALLRDRSKRFEYF